MAPSSDPTDALAALLDRAYGIAGSLARIGGENENYRVDAADGERFVLKLGPVTGDGTAGLEAAAIEHLAHARIGIALPRAVPSLGGGAAVSFELDGTDRCARLFPWVEGRPLLETLRPSDALLFDVGATIARIDRVLETFSHPQAQRSHAWDLTRAGELADRIPLVESADRRRILETAFHLWRAVVRPRFTDLPRSFIHGDANDENLLVDGDRVVGLLDFGDALVNPVVCELAITLAYALLDRPDPLAAGAHIVAGFHSERPLRPVEIEVLFPLILARLAVSVCIAAERRRIVADHPNWFITEARAWTLLERLAGIDPADAARTLASRIDVHAPADEGEPPEVLLERRNRAIGPSLSIAYRNPLKMVRGEGAYLHDHRGRPFLDLVNNVCHVGHCHPHVVEAGQRQMARLNTNTRYLYDGLTEYAERLCATLPEPLRVCYFVNSGSEANELALRLARTHTGRHDIVVTDAAYHGHTGTLIDTSPYKFMGRGGTGAPAPWVHVAPLPDGYRGEYRGRDRETGIAYGNAVGQTIAEAGAPVAAFITESLSSCGGQIIPPPGWLETAFRHAREVGAVCIADEVQTGFGRVGSHFWAFEMRDARPDIVVLGKPIGNGHPMAAVITTPEIAASFDNGMEFFSTFGGNPVSCAIGMAVLDVIENEDLQAHAAAAGAHFLAGLQDLATRHPLIGDVRGAGLFLGVELVRDRDSLEPAAEEAREIVDQMVRRGVLLSIDGPLHNVLKIKPPMVLTTEDIDMVVRLLDDVLSDVWRSD